MSRQTWFLTACLFAVFYPVAALAYVDPNTAGLLFQVFVPIIAFFAGTWALIRRKASAIWRKILGREEPLVDAPTSSADDGKDSDETHPDE